MNLRKIHAFLLLLDLNLFLFFLIAENDSSCTVERKRSELQIGG